jgi:chromosome segregation ATPase
VRPQELMEHISLCNNIAALRAHFDDTQKANKEEHLVLKQRITDLEKDNRRLEREHTERKIEITRLNGSIRKLESESKIMLQDRERVNRVCDELRKENSGIKTGIYNLETQNHNLEYKHKALEMRIGDLEKEMRELRSDHLYIKKQHADIMREYADIKNDNTNSKNEYVDIKDEYTVMMNEHTDSTNKYAYMNRLLQELLQESRERRERLLLRSVAKNFIKCVIIFVYGQEMMNQENLKKLLTCYDDIKGYKKDSKQQKRWEELENKYFYDKNINNTIKKFKALPGNDDRYVKLKDDDKRKSLEQLIDIVSSVYHNDETKRERGKTLVRYLDELSHNLNRSMLKK